MHEIWLQKYIKQYYRQIGFSRIHGPYSQGADFKGFYADKAVKIEAEWDYADYIKHKHGLGFADILVVATLEPVPEKLKAALPPIVKNLERARVIAWAQPRFEQKNQEDYYAYPWRRLSRSLLDLYTHYQKENQGKMDYIGVNLAHSRNQTHTPEGFQFDAGGRETGFSGCPDDRAAWDYWLLAAHDTAAYFKLKPALLRPTWIDRIALYFHHTGHITAGEQKRFKEVGEFVDTWLSD